MQTVVAAVHELGSSSDVVAVATAEAQKRGASLVLLHAWEAPVYAGRLGVAYVGARKPKQQHQERDLLDALTQQVRTAAPDISVEPVFRLGRASDLLVEYSRTADLVVMGHHGHLPEPEVILGSTARSVLRRAHCPVIIVPCAKHPDAAANTSAEPEAGSVQHVIVGDDGSSFSNVAMAWAQDESVLWDAPLTVVHGSTDLHHEATAADLIVVGAQGRSAIGRLLLGSVTTSLVEHLPCPVVVVPA
jgi:nucleotide-binding universal stress UspA family protein